MPNIREDADVMSHQNPSRTRPGIVRIALASALALGAFAALPASAQVPARFYWKTLSGGNAVPVVVNSISGNTNPFDPAHVVSPDAEVNATLLLSGYAHTFTWFGRSAMAALIVPMGRLSGEVSGVGTVTQTSAGFGDPMFEFDLNIVGPKAQRSIPDVLRYEPRFTIDILADLAVPIGEYDNTQSLNIGQNRWYGRIGAPVLLQLGGWVPGRRTTLEFLPAVWLFGPNEDYVGRTLKTDPMFQLDSHFTRDLTEHLWTAFDVAWYTGGAASIDGVAGEKLNNVGLGFTLGYALNENLAMTVGYKSTVHDRAPDDLKMDGFMVSLVYGWHPIIEGMKRLKGGE
jgi:hypothetical protein